MEQIVININSQYTTAFLNFLKTLNYIEVKKVRKNIENTVSEEENALSSLVGAWQDERSAEEIIDNIQQSRHFSRAIEGL